MYSICCIDISQSCDWVFYFYYGSIILTGLWASIEVTHPFLCTLVPINECGQNGGKYNNLIVFYILQKYLIKGKKQIHNELHAK